VTISYHGVVVCSDGIAANHDADALAKVMQLPHIEIQCDLGAGSARTWVTTTDLSHAYIDENRGTS
jgi:N-acetylglutamate synthase/N-acetylornithine aminotransferase